MYVEDCTKTIIDGDPGYFYYAIIEGGCSCDLFVKRNREKYGGDFEHLIDFREEIKSFVENLTPGTQILSYVTEGDNYSIFSEAEKMFQIFSKIPILKTAFIEAYPYIKDRVVYELQ